jgi:hypothetical protein
MNLHDEEASGSWQTATEEPKKKHAQIEETSVNRRSIMTAGCIDTAGLLHSISISIPRHTIHIIAPMFCISQLSLMSFLHQLQHHSIIQQEEPSRNGRTSRRHNNGHFSSDGILSYT